MQQEKDCNFPLFSMKCVPYKLVCGIRTSWLNLKKEKIMTPMGRVKYRVKVNILSWVQIVY